MNINKAMQALTVPEEQAELRIIDGPKPRKIKFAFFQKQLEGPALPYWHVDWVSAGQFGTTLSMEGLKRWGYIK